MKKIISVVIFASLLLMLSCGKSTLEIVTVPISTTWIPVNLNLFNPPEKSGTYEGMLYYTEAFPEKLVMHFTDENGNKQKTLTFKRGKGPGEVEAISLIRVQNKIIYMYDLARQKVSMFDLAGTYVDEIPLSKDMGMFGVMDFMDKTMYYHAYFGKKLSKLELEHGQLLKSIEHEKPSYEPNDIAGKDFEQGIIRADSYDKKIYISYYIEPYRIEVYNTDLQLEHVLTRDLPEAYEKMKFDAQGGVNGNMLVSSLEADEHYIYAPFGGGQRTIIKSPQDVKIEGVPKKFYISVFDKKKKKCIREIHIDKLVSLNGVISILGTTQKSIFLLVIDMGNTLEGIIHQKEEDKTEAQKQLGLNYSIIVIPNPMYDSVKK